MDGLKPVICLTFNGQEVPILLLQVLVGGSRTTTFNWYKPAVASEDISLEAKAGGTGSGSVLKGYAMPELTFFLSGKPVSLNKVFINQDPISANREIYFSNIGQDFIRQSKSRTISFKGAYIAFG